MDLMFDPPSGSKASRLEVWENMLVSYFSFSRMAASICVRMFIIFLYHYWKYVYFFQGATRQMEGCFVSSSCVCSSSAFPLVSRRD